MLMSLYVGCAVCVVVVGVALMQAVFAAAYVRQLCSRPRKTSRTRYPKAAVVLSVRGPDPFLDANMASLLDQDYPDFRVFIIVDSEYDAAWPFVERVRDLAPDRVETLVLQKPLCTCSLKCSSVAEAVEHLDDSFEVVAFLDGDAPPYRNWLRDLVEPLNDPAVGVTTGNRWYTPSQIGWGTMVRYFWNAGAVVQVWLNDITWAGSMALRRDVIHKTGLIAAWRKSFVDDAAVVAQMREFGYQTRFVPTAIMANRENIALDKFIPWAERQMIAARSSGSGWSLVLSHAAGVAFSLLAPLAVLTAGLVLDEWQLVPLALGAMAAYWGGAILSTLAIEVSMQRIFRRNEVPSPWLNARAALWIIPGIVATHFVYLRLLIGACLRNRVSWRGVEYELQGISGVRLLYYRPYQMAGEDAWTESVV
jgi:hypothetical protein